ncbi:hypothetical protein Tco_0404817 [Tanacetum coccineum]
MSQPANDVFSQHLSDDEASFHEDALDNDGVIRALPPVSAVEIHAVEKERKARNLLTYGNSQGTIREDFKER